MLEHGAHTSTYLGTTTGVLLSLAINIPKQEIFNTIVLTAIGGTVSFLVSIILKWLATLVRKHNKRSPDSK